MRVTLIALVLIAAGCSSKREEPRPSPFAELAKRCPDSELSCPRPIFAVAGLKASQAYYRDKLGFKLDWEYGEPPDFGSMSRSDLTLFLGESKHTAGSWVMTFAKDVDALHREFVRRGAIIQMAPTDMPWGIREMHVADPDGNVIRFGTGIEH